MTAMPISAQNQRSVTEAPARALSGSATLNCSGSDISQSVIG